MVDILGHTWMRGNVVSKEYFEAKAKVFLDKATAEQKKQNEEYGIDKYVERIRRSSDNDFDSANFLNRTFRAQKAPSKQSSMRRTKQFEVKGKALEIMKSLYFIAKQDLETQV